MQALTSRAPNGDIVY